MQFVCTRIASARDYAYINIFLHIEFWVYRHPNPRKRNFVSTASPWIIYSYVHLEISCVFEAAYIDD